MGEYIQFAGQIKLGVCQDLFYTSFDAVRRMVAGGAAQVPGNHEPAQYLNERYQWRYRFPWPDEPGGIGENYERAMAVEAPPGLIELLKADWDHSPMRWFVQPHSGAPGVSLSADCPQVAAPTWVEVYLQKQVEGRLWLIVRCPYCHALARLPEAEARMLTAHMRASAAGDAFKLAVADRIEAGYAAPKMRS